MYRRPPRSNRTTPPFPYTRRFRSWDAEPRPAERARLKALAPPPRLRRFDLRHRRVRYDPAFRVGPQILAGVKSEAIEAMIEGPERGRQSLGVKVRQWHAGAADGLQRRPLLRQRSAARRAGQECLLTCRTRWAPYN